MSRTVYDAVSQAAEWHRALGRCPVVLQDVYYYPEYVCLFCAIPGAVARLFVYEEAEETWLNAVVLSPAVDKATDVETAYGYGGPITTSTEPGFLAGARADYLDWLDSQNAIAELVRYHPLLENARIDDPALDIEYNCHTLSIELSTPPSFKGRAANSVKRARNGGVEVIRVSACDQIERFRTLYEENMRAVDAGAFYFFDDAHYQDLARLIDDHGMLLAAVLDDQWLATSMFLKGKTFLHYHLSAADFNARVPGSVNLILLTAAQIGHEEGLERLHLGGGRTTSDDDSLFFFKKSMSTDQHDFHIGKRVVSAEQYEPIRAEWRARHPDLVEAYGHRLLCYRYQG